MIKKKRIETKWKKKWRILTCTKEEEEEEEARWKRTLKSQLKNESKEEEEEEEGERAVKRWATVRQGDPASR